MMISKNWFLLSCNVGRLWDVSHKATLGDNMLDNGGVKEEEIKRRKNKAKTEGHILTPPTPNLTHPA